MRPLLVPPVFYRFVLSPPRFETETDVNSIRTSSLDMDDGMDEVLQRRGVLEQMINDGAWCVVCGKPPVDPRIAECEHIFCLRWYVLP